jgi:hypothetical protein
MASLLGLSFRLWGAMIWMVLLQSLGAKFTNYLQLLYVYAKSWMGRYLPGNVTWVLGKIHFASQHGIDKTSLAVSATLEASIQIATTMGLSLLVLSLDSRFNVIGQQIKLLLMVLGLIIFGCLCPPLFNWLIGKIYSVVTKKTLKIKVTWSTITRGVMLYAIGFVLSGLSYYFFTKSIYPPTNHHELLYIIGTFNLAGVVGILAFFAPSGLGVREGIQLILLSAIMPKESALLITVTARLWSTIIDVLFFIMAYLVTSFKRVD